MSPSSRLILNISNRIKYSIWILMVLSIIVFFITKSYYSTKPVFFISKSKLFPISANSSTNSSPFLREMSGMQGSEDNRAYYNLEELIKSRTIREVVASKIIQLKGKDQYIYEQAIKDYNTNPENRTNKKVGPDLEQNIIEGGQALKQVLSIKTLESGFVELSCSSYDEDFAVVLGNEVIDILSEFYVKFNEQPLNSSYYQVARMKDSLEYELNKYETALARYLDENKFIVNQEQSLTERRLIRKLNSIETSLASVSTSYYNAKSKVQDNKPIIKVLDRPRKPLSKEENKYKYYPLAFAILTFIVAFFLSHTDVFVRYLREALQVQKERLITQES